MIWSGYQSCWVAALALEQQGGQSCAVTGLEQQAASRHPHPFGLRLLSSETASALCSFA